MNEYEDGLTHLDSINVIAYYIKKLPGTEGNISVITLSCWMGFLPPLRFNASNAGL